MRVENRRQQLEIFLILFFYSEQLIAIDDTFEIISKAPLSPTMNEKKS
jgi:hypothetical protein